MEKLAQLRKTREEQRASLKASLRRELAVSLLRASESAAVTVGYYTDNDVFQMGPSAPITQD